MPTGVVNSDDVTRIGLCDGLSVLGEETLRRGEVDRLLHPAVAHLGVYIVCMYVCMYVCIYVCMYVLRNMIQQMVCMYVCMYE